MSNVEDIFDAEVVKEGEEFIIKPKNREAVERIASSLATEYINFTFEKPNFILIEADYQRYEKQLGGEE